MALSNIFREPRREITESAVGIAATVIVVAGVGLPFYWLSRTLRDMVVPNMPLPLAMVVLLAGGTVVVVAGVGLLVMTHAIGEDVCDMLQRRGWRLRPLRRPVRPPRW